MSWQARQGEVLVCLEEAEWWGASLAVLGAAVHHPHLLAEQQPANDPAEVAREVRSGLDELLAAVACAEEQGKVDQLDRPRKASVRREGDTVVFSPGPEVANLALCLTIFATAVLEPGSPDGTTARGAVAYVASAWSRDIGKATGAL